MNTELELTIAICTYRRFSDLDIWIKEMEKQTISKNRFKVLFIDNSVQPEISQEFQKKINVNYQLEYVITQKSGLSYARNLAIEKCTTKYIAFIDDDVIVEPNWAEELLDTFKRYEGRAGCVCGIVAPNWLVEKPHWVKDELLYPLALINWGDKEKLLPENEWLVGAFMGFDMEALRRTEGFSEKLGRKGKLLLAHEDLQITLALRDLGYGIVYNPKLYGRHSIGSDKLNEEWFCKDYFWQTVSRKIFALGLDTDGMELGNELNNGLEQKLKKHTNKNTKEGVIKDRIEYEELAIRILAKHGYATEKYLPDPPYPCVYIVTPSLNSVKTIKETLLSVCMQKGDFFVRYHVQDGGSTDETLDILKKFKDVVNKGEMFSGINKGIVFTYSSEKDIGMYDAIAKAFNKLPIPLNAIMTWINSDDILMPGALAMVTECLKFDGVSWVTGYQCVRLEDGKQMHIAKRAYPTEVLKKGLCDGCFYSHIQQEGTFWRKSLWDRAGGIDTTLKYAADWDLWYRFSKYAQLYHIPAITGCFTIREGQLSQHEGGQAYEREISRIISPGLRRKNINEVINSKKPLLVNMIGVRGKDEKYKVYSYTRELRNYDIESSSASIWEYFRKYFNIHQYGKKENEIKKEIPQNKSSFLLILTESRFAYSIYKKLPKPLKRICHNIKAHGLENVFSIKKIIQQKKEYMIIKKSGIFLNKYYLDRNPDVKKKGIDPIKHYVRHGSREGRMANPLFNDGWYYSQYKDVRDAGVNAFAHYLKYGWKEGRDPGLRFSTNGYLSKYADVKEANICPLIHYILHGIVEGRGS